MNYIKQILLLLFLSLLITTGMAATEERKKVINFTLGMYKSQSYIIYTSINKKLNNPNILQDFNKNNLTTGIELGTIYHSFIKEKNIINKANIQIYESGSDIATALISGRIYFTFHGSNF